MELLRIGELLRIVLGSIVSLTVLFAVLWFFDHRQKLRELADPHSPETEKRRAERIVAGLGLLMIWLLQLASGLVVSVPAFALLFWIGSGTRLPTAKEALLFGAMYVGGAIAFAWCQRVTNPLRDRAG